MKKRRIARIQEKWRKKQMKIEQFSERVKAYAEERFGSEFKMRIQKVIKNNSISLIGLFITRQGECAGPVIYMESYYKKYIEGTPVEQITEDIFKEYRDYEPVFLLKGALRLMTWSQVKDKVVFKLVSAERNKELLKELPHRETVDLTVIYYLFLSESDSGQYAARITNEHIELLGVTESDLFMAASVNTPEILPPVIKSIKEVLCEVLKDGMGEDMVDDVEEELCFLFPPHLIFCVFTNKIGMEGAACILYKNVWLNLP